MGLELVIPAVSPPESGGVPLTKEGGRWYVFGIDSPYHPPAPSSPDPSWLRLAQEGKFGIIWE